MELTVLRTGRRIRAEISDCGRWRQGVHNHGDRGSGLMLMQRVAQQVTLEISERGTKIVIVLGAGQRID